MRRSTLDLLRCTKCGAASLVPEADVPKSALSFGPVSCLGCSDRFPVHDGLIDFVHEPHRGSPLQQAMKVPWIARSWDRTVRHALDAVLTQGQLDQDSEYTVLRNFVGASPGPLVDLGCGAGHVLRKLCRDYPATQIIGVDVSRAMIEEAMAQVREHAWAADFVRVCVPPLPFNDACIKTITAIGLLQLVEDLDALLSEVARVLKPGGRLVGTSYHAARVVHGLHRGMGLFPRNEQTIRSAIDKAGLVGFERVKVSPFMLWKAERP
jgi:ubiquinone/menaquinone biosynthesis C-methylase UbiE